jgi:hypothetical protein
MRRPSLTVRPEGARLGDPGRERKAQAPSRRSRPRFTQLQMARLGNDVGRTGLSANDGGAFRKPSSLPSIALGIRIVSCLPLKTGLTWPVTAAEASKTRKLSCARPAGAGAGGITRATTHKSGTHDCRSNPLPDHSQNLVRWNHGQPLLIAWVTPGSIPATPGTGCRQPAHGGVGGWPTSGRGALEGRPRFHVCGIGTAEPPSGQEVDRALRGLIRAPAGARPSPPAPH